MQKFAARLISYIISFTYTFVTILLFPKKAADAGFLPAQMKLGFFYNIGKGVEENFKEAFNWYYKAALQGYEEAQYKIGKYYHERKGVEQDLNKAIEWYQKSEYHYDSK